MCVRQYFMSQSKQLQLMTRRDNLQNISLAFKKLFDEASIRMHSEAFKKDSNRSILGIKKSQHFFRSRKSSLAVTHRRKNSFYSQTELTSPPHSSKGESQDCSRSRRLSLSRNTHRQAGVSQRCKSQALNCQNDELYNRIASYNELLITKMFPLGDTNSQKTPNKNIKDKKMQRRVHLSEHQEQETCEPSTYQSRIRHCQKNRRLHAVEKKQEGFAKAKQRCKTTELQPWETDKPEEFFYLAQ